MLPNHNHHPHAGFERVGLPFKEVIDLDTFVVRHSEADWIDVGGGMGKLVEKLNAMTPAEVESKLNGLKGR